MPASKRKKSQKKPSAKKVAKRSTATNAPKHKIFKIGKNTPESVKTAKAQNHIQTAQVINSSGIWLSNNFKMVRTYVLVFATLVFVWFGFWLANTYIDNKNYYKKIEQTNNNELAKIEQKAAIIGDKAQLESEIINYVSAPDDLRNYVIRDYAQFKNRCIVNGELVAPTYYEISSVVYDSFAKVLMNCEGEDSQIIAKVGGRWAVIHSGLAAPNCIDVNALSIPMGIAPTCTDGRILYPNPNP